MSIRDFFASAPTQFLSACVCIYSLYRFSSLLNLLYIIDIHDTDNYTSISAAVRLLLTG